MRRQFLTKAKAAVESKTQKKVDMKVVENNLNTYGMSDFQIQNLATNFSIIKHNEFKSISRKEGDIGIENIDFENVSDLNRSQDFHQL